MHCAIPYFVGVPDPSSNQAVALSTAPPADNLPVEGTADNLLPVEGLPGASTSTSNSGTADDCGFIEDGGQQASTMVTDLSDDEDQSHVWAGRMFPEDVNPEVSEGKCTNFYLTFTQLYMVPVI